MLSKEVRCLCSKGGSIETGMQLDIKALQDDVEEEKAEKETPIHVSYNVVVLDYNFYS